MSRAADRLAFLIIAEALCTECNSLIYTDVITNHSRLTDYHSGAVVYAEIVADFSPGWMSIPVSECAISVIIRGTRGRPRR